jgi:hypothetical protein
MLPHEPQTKPSEKMNSETKPTPTQQPLPIWVRLPRNNESCRFTGLRRSKIYSLITGENPAVESRVVNAGGGGRGVRLIRLQSLLNFIEESPGN